MEPPDKDSGTGLVEELGDEPRTRGWSKAAAGPAAAAGAAGTRSEPSRNGGGAADDDEDALADGSSAARQPRARRLSRPGRPCRRLAPQRRRGAARRLPRPSSEPGSGGARLPGGVGRVPPLPRLRGHHASAGRHRRRARAHGRADGVAALVRGDEVVDPVRHGAPRSGVGLRREAYVAQAALRRSPRPGRRAHRQLPLRRADGRELHPRHHRRDRRRQHEVGSDPVEGPGRGTVGGDRPAGAVQRPVVRRAPRGRRRAGGPLPRAPLERERAHARAPTRCPMRPNR